MDDEDNDDDNDVDDNDGANVGVGDDASDGDRGGDAGGDLVARKLASDRVPIRRLLSFRCSGGGDGDAAAAAGKSSSDSWPSGSRAVNSRPLIHLLAAAAAAMQFHGKYACRATK